MAVTQYIGARYVPLFADPIEWDGSKAYEPLTIVQYQGNSYTSRQSVPTGIDITNTSYWALTGNYNAQVEAYRREVATYSDRIDAAQDEAEGASAAAQEVSTALAAEVQARTDADTQIRTDVAANLATEVSRLELEDDALELRIDNLNKYLYFKPEDYGAKGDGMTDDREAIQAAIDAATASGEARPVVVLSANTYLIKDSLQVNGHLMIASLASRLQTPKILADFGGAGKCIIEVNAAQFSMYGVILRATDAQAQLVDGLRYNTIVDVDTVINSCKFMLLRKGIEAAGRSVIVKNTHFSSCTDGIVLHNREEDDDSARGYVITDNRFHSYGAMPGEGAVATGHGIVFDFEYPYFQNSVYIANNYIDRGSSTGAFIYGDIVTGYITNNEFTLCGERFIELHKTAKKTTFEGESLSVANNLMMFKQSQNIVSAIKISGTEDGKVYRVVVNDNVFSNVDGSFVEVAHGGQFVIKGNVQVITSRAKMEQLVKCDNCSDFLVTGNSSNMHNVEERAVNYIVNATNSPRLTIFGNNLEFKNACNVAYFPRLANGWRNFKALSLTAGQYIDGVFIGSADEIVLRIAGQQNMSFRSHTGGVFYAQPVVRDPNFAYGGQISVSNGRMTVLELYTYNPVTGEKLNENIAVTGIVDVR